MNLKPFEKSFCQDMPSTSVDSLAALDLHLFATALHACVWHICNCYNYNCHTRKQVSFIPVAGIATTEQSCTIMSALCSWLLLHLLFGLYGKMGRKYFAQVAHLFTD